MAIHANLTGADLHEPKGVDTAPADSVYVADGSGSGIWQKINSSMVDTGDFDYVSTGDLSAVLKVGTGTPEGNVSASVGTLYLRLDGSTDTTLYVKETGTGTTGWVAK